MMSDPGYSVLDAARILVLAPHADDEALGCGGTIALCASRGAEVRLAAISDGGGMVRETEEDPAAIIGKRRNEAAEASKILGIRHTYYLEFPDGALRSHKEEIKDRIDEIISQFRPDVVLSPSPVDAHDDHMTVSEIACGLLPHPWDVRVAFYEVYETIRFNSLVDITSVLDIKERAILAYRYSLFDVPDVFFEAAKGLNSFRSMYTRRKGYYEAFWVLSGPVGVGEITSWLTYGMGESDPAALFLSKIKAVDKALFELKECYHLLGTKEERIRDLEETARRNREHIHELNVRVDAVNESLAWRMALRFYAVRDRLLPHGSYLRRLYQSALSVIKPDKSRHNNHQ